MLKQESGNRERMTMARGSSESGFHSTVLLARSIFTGTSSLGLAVTLERGLAFLANLLAARIAGVRVFGAYSLAFTTANSVANYAGAGIGTTANRFSGQYPKGTLEHQHLQRSLTLVSLQSACMAGIILWLAAGPMASHLLLNPALAHLLRLASFSAAGIILIECLRGILIGQRSFGALLFLSVLWGGGLLLAMPLAASHGAAAMIIAQASVAATWVAASIACRHQFGIAMPGSTGWAIDRRAWDIWRFGLAQLAGFIGLNAAGWWTSSLVSRGDPSMVQMGFYAAATQLRNIISMVPGLVSQSSYALLTEERGSLYGGAGRVLIACTIAEMLLAMGLAGLGIATLPWTLGRLYGESFRRAELAASLAMCTAVIQMASEPAASRLMIISVRLMGIINGVWTLLVIGLGSWFIRGFAAVEATNILLLAHAVSAVLVLVSLKRLGELPRGLFSLSLTSIAAAGSFAAFAWARFTRPNQTVALSVSILVLTLALGWVAVRLACKFALSSNDFPRGRIRDFAVALLLRSQSTPASSAT
jgi:O-antigen/teichoic acid export membrane protein